MGQFLSVQQVAAVTGKTQDYVRQHIKRGHLAVRREGRAVRALLVDVRKWAEDRGLPWNESALAGDVGADSISDLADRIARVRVVSHENAGHYANLISTVRHRRGRKTVDWHRLEPGDGTGLTVLGADLDMAAAQAFVDQATRGSVDLLGIKINYQLSDRRNHFAARGEHTGLRADGLASPFATHSARVAEYWCVDEPPSEILAKCTTDIPWSKLAGFDLASWNDRVGNLLVFGAVEEAALDISATEGEVRLDLVQDRAFTPGVYQATVCGWLDDDLVMHRTVRFDRPSLRLPVLPDVDAIRATLLDADGALIDEQAHYLIREVRSRIALVGPAVAVMKGKREPARFKNVTLETTVSVGAYRDAIRERQRARRARQADAKAREEGLARFEPGGVDSAVAHLASQIRSLSADSREIYFADPYFLSLNTDTDPHLRAYLKLVEACGGRLLRILCGPDGSLARWRAVHPQLRRNVELRSFATTDQAGNPRPVFHDRFVAGTDGEVVITNSLNGWDVNGVTFVRLNSEVYLAEAKRLWDISAAGVTVTDVF